MVEELLDDLRISKPIIIDTMVSEKQTAAYEQRTIPALTSKNWGLYPRMKPIMDFIWANYKLIGYIGPDDWPMYRYEGPEK